MSSASIGAHAHQESPDTGKMAAIYAAFQRSSNPIFLIDRNGTITDANPAFVEGYTKHYPRCIGANVFEEMAANPVAPKSVVDKRMAAMREALRTGRSIRIEGDAAGNLATHTIDPILAPSGEVTGLCIVIQELRPELELSNIRSQLEFLLERCKLGAWSMDLATGQIHRTTEHERLFGDHLPPDWTINEFLSRIVLEDLDRVNDVVGKIMDNPGNWDMSYRIRRRDGEIRWIHDIGGYECDAEGKPVRLLGVTQDITDRMASDQKQQEQEKLWDITSESCRLGLWKLDLKTLRLQVTPELNRIFGLPPHTVQSDRTSLVDAIIPEDRPWMEAYIGDHIENGKDGSFECRIRRTDGAIRHISVVGKMQYDERGAAIHAYGFIQDITEQREQQEQFEAQLHRWDLGARMLGLGLFFVDVRTLVVVRNGEHAKIFGYDPADAPDWSLHLFLEHVVPEDRSRVESSIHTAIREKINYRVECRIRRRDGAIRWIATTVTLLFGEQHEVESALGVMQDITEQKEQEEQTALLLQELQGRLNQSQKLELIGQLAGGVAHDVNNVLAAIQGNAELVLRDIDATDPHHMNLTSIVNSVSRSAAMVRQLLAFARKQPMNPVETRLDEELGKAQLMLRKLVRENIALEWHLDASDAVVRLDPSSLVQILTNLVVNARDAITDGGRISVSTAIIGPGDGDYDSCRKRDVEGAHVCITVTDTGTGIDAQTLPHIFEPFFTTKGIGKGTGLGLSTVYGLARQNNGHIHCHSEAGKGTSFRIHFPVTEHAGAGETAEPAAPPAEARHGKRILVVEDEQEITAIVSMIIDRQGHTVRVAVDAEAALGLLENGAGPFDLVITDVMLPGMNGVQLSRHVLQRHPETKFLFMSGYSTEAIAQYGSFDEAANFIAKPFRIDAFLNKVQEMLHQQHS